MASSTLDTSQTNSNIYKYSANMTYVVGEDIYYIESMNIKSIAIDSDYKNMNMPMIFLTLSIDKNLIDIMVQNQDSGSIIFEIKKCVANSDMPDLYMDYLSDKFIYFIAEDVNKNSDADYEGDNEDREDIFKVVTLGLLSLDNVNNNKKIINGVVNGNLSSVLYFLTSHLPIVIEPPTNNTILNNQFLPPMNSVSKSIKYINSLYTIYSTSYRFFIDFYYTYLISSSGKFIKRKGEDIGTVYLNIKNSYNEGSKVQGMRINESQSMYEIEIDGIDCELSDNHVSDKSYSTVSATSTSGTVSSSSLSNKSEDSVIVDKTMSVRISNDNFGLLDNMISSANSSAVQILVQKVDIDSEVLTMNKEYIIKADEVYNTESYNGNYILTRKRELYVREDEDFSISVMLLFEKVAT